MAGAIYLKFQKSEDFLTSLANLFFVIIVVTVTCYSIITNISFLYIPPYQPAMAQPTTTGTTNFTAYENSVNGITMQYPSDWQKVDNTNNTDPRFIQFISPGGVLSGSAWIGIIDFNNQSSITPYKELKQTIAEYRTNVPGFNVSGSTNTNASLAGYPAYVLVYNFTDPQYGIIKAKEIGTIIGNKHYFVQFYAGVEENPSYDVEIRQMINSFKISDFITYKDPELGIIKIDYPSVWKKVDYDNSVIFGLTKNNNPNDFRAYFAISSLPAENTLLKDIVSDEVTSLKPNLTQITDSSKINFKGNDAYKLDYTINFTNQGAYKTEENITLINNKIYYIIYRSLEDDHSNYLPTFQKIISSLEIQGSGVYHPEKFAPRIGSRYNYIGLLTDPFNNRLYSLSRNFDIIYINDTLTNKVIGNITVGKSSSDMVLNPDNHMIYTINLRDNSTSVIDSFTKRWIKDIYLGSTPNFIDVDPRVSGIYGVVFVALQNNTISVIDDFNQKVVSHIKVGENPSQIIADPILHKLYVVNTDSNNISIIDYFMDPPGVFKIKSINKVAVASKPISMDINPNTNRVYVTNGTGVVYVINGLTNKIIDNMTLDTNADELFINPVNNNLYIIDSYDDTIFSVNSSKNKTAIHIDNRPFTMSMDTSNNILYVLSFFSDTVSMINGTDNVPIFGITFKINNEGSGEINCAGKKISSYDYVKYELGKTIQCKVQPSPGFIFASWSGDVANNSNNNALTFTAEKHGTLVANFKQAPPNFSIPDSYLTGVILGPTVGAVLGGFLGWYIPFLMNKRATKKQGFR